MYTRTMLFWWLYSTFLSFLIAQELNGKLIIAPARKQDSGIYICVASNIVGVRESRAARLTVLGKHIVK